MVKKILLQLDSDAHPSAFDQVAAYDGGADHIMSYGGVRPQDVRALVYGVMFTRGAESIKNSAVFVGGSDVEAGEALLAEVTGSFFGSSRTSVMMDSNGCNTTAAAAVARITGAVDVAGKKALVMGATGPVGPRRRRGGGHLTFTRAGPGRGPAVAGTLRAAGDPRHTGR